MSNSSPSQSSSSPSSLLHNSAWRHVPLAGDVGVRSGRASEADGGDDHSETRPRTGWSIDDAVACRYPALDTRAAAAPRRPSQVQLRRLSEDAGIDDGQDNTSPLVRRVASSMVLYGDADGVPRSFTSKPQPLMQPRGIPHPSVASTARTVPRRTQTTHHAAAPSRYESLTCSSIDTSPPTVSLNVSKRGATASTTATTNHLGENDNCSQDCRVNAGFAQWPSPPPPLATSMLRDSLLSAPAADTISATSMEPALPLPLSTMAPPPRIPASSRIPHASLVPPAADAHYWRLSSTKGSGARHPYNSACADGVVPVATHPSIATTHAFESVSSCVAQTADVSVSELNLSEIRSSATPLPRPRSQRLSSPPSCLPAQPVRLPDALPLTQVGSVTQDDPTSLMMGTIVTSSSSVVMSASALSSPSPALLCNSTRPSFSAPRSLQRSGEGTAMPENCSPAAPLATASTSPTHPSLLPPHSSCAPHQPQHLARASGTGLAATNVLGHKRNSTVAPQAAPSTHFSMSQQQQQQQPAMRHLDVGHIPQYADLVHNAAAAPATSAAKAASHTDRGEVMPMWHPLDVQFAVASPPSPPPGPPPPLRMTLASYMQQMETPTVGSRRFSLVLVFTAVCLCGLPLCLCVLLLGLHYWAIELQERSYAARTYRPHTGAMLTTSFTLMLGVLLCVVVMGLGGGMWLYAVVYRHGIRYQQHAFALCARLSRTFASAAQGESHAAREIGDASAHPQRLRVTEMLPSPAVTHEECALPHVPLPPSSSRVFRWHREVYFLLDALAAPLEAVSGVAPFFETPPQLLANAPFLATADRAPQLATLAPSPLSVVETAAAGVAMAGVRASAPLPGTMESLRSSSGHGAREDDRLPPMALSRRPHHPVDESRLKDVVTVVVCRFLVPPPLQGGDQPLSRGQLAELEELAQSFHACLRSAVQGRQAYMTECGVAEVVFSINTVLPVQVLVANATAVAVALAAQKALTEWSPAFGGRPVRWGVAVHRYGAILRPVRGGNGRLALSFGTLEFDVVRTLAQLAALCDYGVLCHADFFVDAMGEARGMPVDYVMDRMRRRFLVYQLHGDAVPEGSKRSMVHALDLMRGGRYTEASRFLRSCIAQFGEGECLPKAALHLLYVTHYLSDALRRHDLGNADAAVGAVPGFAEWSSSRLARSYCRLPPVWEEEADLAPATRRWSSLTFLSHSNAAPAAGEMLSALPAYGENWGQLTRRASPPLPHPPELTDVAGHPAAVGGSGGSGVTALLQRALPHFFCDLSHASTSLTPSREDASQQQRLQRRGGARSHGDVFDGGVTSLSSGSRGLRSPATVDASVRVESGLLSPLTPRSAMAKSPPVVVSALFTTGRFNGTSTPVILLPQALQDAERGAAGRASNPHNCLSKEADGAALGHPSNPFQPRSARERSGVPDDSSRTTPVFTGVSETLKVPRSPAALPTVQSSHGVQVHHSSEGVSADGMMNVQPQPTTRTGGSRPVRRKGSSDSRGSRSRGRSCSILFEDESAENDFVADATPTAAPHSFKAFEYTRSAVEEVSSYLPTSAQSAQSLTLSGHTQHRSAHFSAKLPLFPDSATTLPGAENGDASSINSSSSISSSNSLAEVSRERSTMSVMLRSRSTMSVRAASVSAAVVCTRTRCIASDLGGTTRVFQGFHPSGYLVAIKQVDKRAPRVLQLLRSEIQILRRMSHANIVHIIAEWENEEVLCMAIEYACDTLTSVLAKFNRLLPGAVRHYVRGVLRALAYLHDAKGVVHRDVSPNNIIVTNASDSSQAKLIDFGRSMPLPRSRSVLTSPVVPNDPAIPSVFTRATSQSSSHRRHARSTELPAEVYGPVVGTPMFMSPQACQGLVHPANDIWSVGVIMFLCLTGTYPYPKEASMDPDVFIADVGCGRLEPTLAALQDATASERDFIEQCLRVEYTQRPTAAALLNHSFLVV